MSLLNKINAVRIWAKEGGIRSAINAHAHKRFAEVSLSGNLSPELFQFGQVGRYGMTGMASIVAFDPVQSLLAVGTFQGVIHLFGQGITTTLMLKDPVAIKFLSFKTGDSLLVVIDSKNTLTIFDLTTGRPLGSHFLRGVVTCIESCQGTDWLFLGFNDGKVDAFDLSHGRTTEYNIPNLMAEWREVQRKEQEGDHPSSDRPKYRKVDMVVALQFHPKDLNQLLIGYQTGAILFNIKQNLAVRVFEFSSSQERRSHLTVLSFKPDGTHIAAGYDDGLLVFWDIRYEEKPLAARPVYEAEPDRTSTSSRRTSTFSQEPIYRLAWCSPASLDESFLIVAGGSGPPGLHGLHLLNFGKEANYRTPKRQTVLPVPEDISDFIVLPWSSPWYLGTHDPLGVIVLTAGGALRAVNVQPGAPEYQLPSSLDFLNPRTVQAFFFPQIRDHVFQVLAAQPAEDGPSQHPHLPLTGGSALENHVHRVRSLDLLATAHVDGSVRLWDASFVALRGMPWLTVQTRVDVPREGRAEACSVDVCTMTGEMAVGLKSGCVLVYRVRGCETMPRGGNMGVEATEANLRTTGVAVEELDAILKEMKEEVRAVEETKDAAGSGNPTTTTTTTIMTTDLVVSPEGTMDSINHSPPPISVVTTHPTQPGSGLSTPLRTPVTEEPRRLESNSASPTMERAPAGPLGGPIHGGMVVPRPTVTSLVEKYAAEEGRVLVPRMLVQVLRGAVRVLAIAEVGILAAGDDLGNLIIVDTNTQAVIHSSNVNVHTPAEPESKEGESEDQAAAATAAAAGGAAAHQKLPADRVTTLAFFKSYLTEDEPTPLIHLIVGTHLGHTIVHTLHPVPHATYIVNDAVLIPTHKDCSRTLYATVLNLRGEVQTASSVETRPVVARANSQEEPNLTPSAGEHQPHSDLDDAHSIVTVSTVTTDTTSESVESVASPVTPTSPGLPAVPAKENEKVKEREGGFIKRSFTSRRKSEKESAVSDLPRRAGTVKVRGSDPESRLSSVQGDGPVMPAARPVKQRVQHEPHYFVSVSTTGVRVFLNVSGNKLYSAHRAEGEGVVVRAGLVKVEDECCLVCVLDNSKMVAYSLPKLEVIAEVELPPTYIAERLWQSSVAQDGRLCMWTGQFEYRQYTFLTNNNIPYGESIQLINPARQLPERPTIANTSRSWFASVFTSETLSVKELDEIVGGPNRPPPRLTHHGGGHHGGGHHGGGEASGSGAEDGKQFGGAFDELKQKMNERGERLNELDAKFADMNAASGDFLKSIREYNERQAQKKWYEF